MINQAIGRIKTASKTLIRSELDSLDLLRSDHMKVEAILLQLRLSRDPDTRTDLLRRLKGDLEKHMKLEEEIFYPACERHEELKPLVEHSYDEHQGFRTLLMDLMELPPGSQRFAKKVSQTIREIEHHVRDEENRLFPRVRDVMDKREFAKLNREIIQAHGPSGGTRKKTQRKEKRRARRAA